MWCLCSKEIDIPRYTKWEYMKLINIVWDFLPWVSSCCLNYDRSNIVVKATKLSSTEFVCLAFLPLCPLHMPESLSLSAEMNFFVSSHCETVALLKPNDMFLEARVWQEMAGRWILVMLSAGSFPPDWATGRVTLACWVWMHYSSSRPRWGYFTLSWTSKPSNGSSFDVLALLAMSPCFWFPTGRVNP